MKTFKTLLALMGLMVAGSSFGQKKALVLYYSQTSNTKAVAQEIANNAISASTRDPRFVPVRENELSSLEINVDVLGQPEDIASTDELDVRKYGVIVSTSDGRRGLLLPDLEGVDTVQLQVGIAMSKGGIMPHETIHLQRFQVIRHK